MLIYAELASPLLLSGIIFSFVPLAGLVCIVTGERSTRKRRRYSIGWTMLNLAVFIMFFMLTFNR